MRKRWLYGPKDENLYENTPVTFSSSYRFSTSDKELAAAIVSKIGYPGEKSSDGATHFACRNADDYETCHQLKRELEEKRRASASGWLPVTRSIGASGQAAQDVDVADEPGDGE